MKRFFFLTIVAFLIGVQSLCAQIATNGLVKDIDTGKPLPGVTVQVQGTSISVQTDANGEYQLPSLLTGNYIISFTLIGFQPFELQFEVKDGAVLPEVSLKHAQLDESQNQTFSEVTISSDDLDMDSKSESVSGMLQSTADPFESAVSYVFSPARFKIRGYDAEYSLTYMNGIPVNDPESGFGSWSSWGGLNDVTRNRESRYGILTSDFAFGGIGGVLNLNTRASQARVGTRVSYASTNRTYTNRVMATHSTGMMKNGYAFTISASRRWAEEGYVEGTFYDAYAYFFSVEKKLNEKHSLAFTAFNAPVKRGMQGAASDEANRLVGSNFYNPNWGYQNGKKRNARIRNQQEPNFILNHYWDMNEKMKLTTNVGYSFGTFQTTALNWYGNDPRPDYYRNLPSYNSDSDPQETYDMQVYDWQNDINTQQINWDELYQINYSFADSSARYILENRITDSKQFSFSSVLNWNINTNMKTSAGVEMSMYKGRNYKQVEDLLGGNYWLDIDPFTVRDVGIESDTAQNDLDNPNKLAKEGDTFGNDYTANVNKGSVWAVTNYSTNHFDYYVGLNLDYSEFWRTGHMRNGRFRLNSKGDSEKKTFYNYGIKGGSTWKINGRNFVDFNMAYITVAPFFRNSFISPRTSNRTVDGLVNEKIASADINYNLRSPYIKARISAYYTKFMDQNELKSFYSESEKTFVNYSMTGIDKIHKGIEIGAEIKATTAIKVKLAASLANYQYKSRPSVTITKDNSGDVVKSGKSIYIENFYVPNTPQTAAMIGIDYAAPKFWYFSVNASYFGDTYIDFSPDRRSADVVDPLNPDINILTEQQSVPSAMLFDASIGKSYRIKKYFINFNFSVSNIFDKTDFSTGGYEQLRYGTAEDVKKFPPRHYYAFGRTYYLIVGLRF